MIDKHFLKGLYCIEFWDIIARIILKNVDTNKRRISVGEREEQWLIFGIFSWSWTLSVQEL